MQNLTGGAEYKKAPVLYDNTTANRNAKLNTKTSVSENPVKFKVKKLWAFSNGGFYLNITSISGNKMKVSVHMPKMDRNNITAIIDSNGKKATAKFTCSDGERHTLTFVVSGNGILLGGLQQTNIRLRLHMDFIHNHTFIKLKNYRKVEERKKSG